MLLLEFPSIIEKYSEYFESCFTDSGFQHFKKALSGFMVSENKTLEAINKMFVKQRRDQSSFNRFFNNQNFDLEQINEVRLDFLQEFEGTRFKASKGDGVLSIDNSLLKHYGKKFDNIYYHYDYVHKCFRWSHDLVTLHYSDNQTDYPVYHQLWDPPDWEAVADFLRQKNITVNQQKWDNRHSEPQKWRNYIRNRFKVGYKKYPEITNVYKSKLHIGEALLRKFCQQYPELDFPIALDSGYTSADLCHKIDTELHRAYVGALRLDQCMIQQSGEEVLLQSYVDELRAKHRNDLTKPIFQKVGYPYKGKKLIAYAYAVNKQIKGFQTKQRLVISFLKEDLTDRPNLTITNRLDWHPSGILRIRRHRWPIETYHQEGKAEGLEKYQLRNQKAIQTYITFIVVAYSMLKCSIHDSELLSSIRQRLQTETDPTLPFLRKLMKAEGLLVLIEYISTMQQQGHSIDQILQTLLPSLL